MRLTDKRDLTIAVWTSLIYIPEVLQKLGKTVETKDERFEQSASNFHQQQVIWRMGMEAWRKKEDVRAASSGRTTAGSADQQASLLNPPSPRSQGHGVTYLLLILPLGTTENYLSCSCSPWF